jgi:membrane protein
MARSTQLPSRIRRVVDRGRVGLQFFLPLKWWFVAVIQGFQQDNCLLRGSALTYVTSLAIVPFFAVAFSVSKGLGFQNSVYIQKFLLRVFAQNGELVDQVIQYINNTNVATLGMLGVAFIIVTVFLLFNNIETSFNVIWGVKAGRTPVRKFTDYLALILICPFLVIASFSITAYLQKSHILEQVMGAPFLPGLRVFVLGFFLPLLPVVLGLFVIYTVIPNVRVKIRSASAGALIASILLQVTQWYFVRQSMGGHNYNAIYGSFAQVPLAFLLMYWSWVVVLFGAEVSYAVQNFKKSSKSGIGKFGAGEGMPAETRLKIGLELLIIMTRRARSGHAPLESSTLAQKLRVPLKDVNKVLDELVALGFVAQICQDESMGYGLYRLPQALHLMDIVKALMRCSSCPEKREKSEDSALVSHVLEAFYRSASQSPENMTLEEFAEVEGGMGDAE